MTVSATNSSHNGESSLVRVGECLYRHKSSKKYYGLFKRSGKQFRRSLKTTDRKIAERRLSDFKKKVNRLIRNRGTGKATFREVAILWFKTKKPYLKDTSARRRQVSINQLNPYFGNHFIRAITLRACEEWVQRRSPKISASSFNNERETLISIFEYAIREGFAIDNPALKLKRRKLIKKPIIIPSRDQFNMLVKTLHDLDPRYWYAANLLEFLAYSGMRLTEATSILWREIDFEKDRFIVTGGEKGTKNYEARIVPLSPAMKGFLQKLRNDDQPEPLSSVIPIGTAKKAMQKACKIADLPHFTHHSMRHFFVSNAIEVGVDFKTIAAWLGHKDGGILVAKTYGHLRDTHSAEMAKRMNYSIKNVSD